MGTNSSRNVGEGIARVNGPWCEELSDTSLKSLLHAQQTMVKEEVFFAGHLYRSWFGSMLTVGSNQKVLNTILGSSVGCREFSVEDRKG